MTTDIRVGDLVKATLKKDADTTITGRVRGLNDYYVETVRHYLERRDFDFEVLERPIDEELLQGARNAYATSYGFLAKDATPRFGEAIKAVVEFVREYDSKKESK